MIRAAAIAWCLCVAACGSSESTVEGQQEVRIVGPKGSERLFVVVDVARTAAARGTGLEGRDELDASEGLLLSFPSPSEVCITNRAVSFSIDAVFFSVSGEVIAVERSVPAGEDRVRCHESTVAVLEVAASVAHLVTVGDQWVDR